MHSDRTVAKSRGSKYDMVAFDTVPADLTPSGECHPVYEEFGSILLFILAFRHHFTLQETDLGAGFSDTFLRSYFHEGRTARRPADLLDSERQRLGNWVKGLFEADGISDELMSNCPPKDFYLLIPTLFDQSVKAFQNGLLSSETVKSGFECMRPNVCSRHSMSSS